MDPEVIWSRLAPYIKPIDSNKISKCYSMLVCSSIPENAHERLIIHPLRTALIMAQEWNQNTEKVLIASFLMNIWEESDPKIQQEIEASAGKVVVSAFWNLTKPRLPLPAPVDTLAQRDARYFANLRKAPAWVRLLKCADRIDNLRRSFALHDLESWSDYSRRSLGWHLFLAKQTSSLAESALFETVFNGEKTLHGNSPIWADGHLIEAAAARMIPEMFAISKQVIGIGILGERLLVGMRNPADEITKAHLSQIINMHIDAIHVSNDGVNRVLNAGLFG